MDCAAGDGRSEKSSPPPEGGGGSANGSSPAGTGSSAKSNDGPPEGGGGRAKGFSSIGACAYAGGGGRAKGSPSTGGGGSANGSSVIDGCCAKAVASPLGVSTSKANGSASAWDCAGTGSESSEKSKSRAVPVTSGMSTGPCARSTGG